MHMFALSSGNMTMPKKENGTEAGNFRPKLYETKTKEIPFGVYINEGLHH